MYYKTLFISILSVCFLFTSCNKNNNVKNRYLRISSPQDLLTLDPRRGAEITSCSIHFMLFEPLTKLTERSTAQNAVAKEIDLSKDMLTYTFHLRDSKWSDGTPLTARDFEYSWKSMLEPDFPCPNANLLYPIKNAEKAKKGLVSIDEVAIHSLDDKTLQVQLEHPTPFFLNLICFCSFAPVKHDIVKDNPNWADKLTSLYVTNGPFRLVEWKADNEIIIEKNPYYWNAENVSLPGIQISIIKDENTAYSMFEKKQLDMLGAIASDISLDAIETLSQQNILHFVPVGMTFFSAFNTQRDPFNNQWIRKALSLAINREAIVSSVADSRGLAAQNFITPTLKDGINKKLFTPFDLSLANTYLRKGLEQLGMTKDDFKKYSMIYTRGAVHHRLAQAIQDDWKKNLGLEITLQCFDKSYFLSRINSGDFDICMHYWVAQYSDQINVFDRFRNQFNPKNYCKWKNTRYGELIDKSYYLTGSDRDQVLEQAEKIFLEEMPLTPIYHSERIYAKHEKIKGLETTTLGSTNFEKVVIDDR